MPPLLSGKKNTNHLLTKDRKLLRPAMCKLAEHPPPIQGEEKGEEHA